MPLLFALLLITQNYTQRGFLESQAMVYPQTVDNDSSHAVGEALFRYESFYKPMPGLQLGGSIDIRTDTHHQTERNWTFSWKDRERRRPLSSVRRLSASYHRGGLSIEAGKQFVRWGKTDIVNPTDRFAPRDFLTVVDNDFLPILAVRGTYEHGANTLDLVWSPRLTPSRLPLSGQRWVVTPAGTILPPTIRSIPPGSQTGGRWSHVGSVEFSAAYYQGFNNLPSFEFDPIHLAIREFYPRLRMIGGDVAVPLRWLTVKMETAHFGGSDPRPDKYLSYVLQLERQSGEWFLVGGYAGEIVTQKGSQSGNFAPDRGLIRTILGRAGYTIDANRSLAFEAAIRDNGAGVWAKFEYSQAFGQHWRLTAGPSLIRGKASDFLGQYRRNSHGLAEIKYSF